MQELVLKDEVNKNFMLKNRPWIAIPGKEKKKSIRKAYAPAVGTLIDS
jgi:hypothetical protein